MITFKCVLKVFFVLFVSKEISAIPKFKPCNDCVSYKECAEANLRAETRKTDRTKSIFQNTFCGFQNKYVKVCCSEFQRLSENNLWIEDRFLIRLGEGEDESQEVEHENLRLLPNECGDSGTLRIVGGSVAKLYEFPWMVLIAYNYGGKNVFFECSGTLINDRYVLTAAHCVKDRNIKGVRIGEYNLLTTTESRLQEMAVKEEIIHPSYNGNPKYENDIALLRLPYAVNLSYDNAQPICLPTTKVLRNKIIANQNGVVAGWGLTENDTDSSVLLKVELPITTPKICQEHYSFINETTQYCAGAHKKDSCRGDSGGPLMIEGLYQGSYKYIQYGIVSSGHQRCGTGIPGIYTDVRKYVTWILDNIRE